jgi:hypothetical protein
VLCTGLWIACADTPPSLCAAWGWHCGYSSNARRDSAPAWGYAVHGLCAGKSSGLRRRAQWSEVIHIRNFTYDVTCAAHAPWSGGWLSGARSAARPAGQARPAWRPQWPQWSSGAPRDVGPAGCAFAGRVPAGLSSIRACVRQTGDSSAGSAGPSTSLLPGWPAQMTQLGGRRPLRARTAGRRGEPHAGRGRRTLTSPGWPRSGKWSLTPIPSSRNVCPATYPRPNSRR